MVSGLRNASVRFSDPTKKFGWKKKNVSKDRLLKIHFPVPGELDESWKNLLVKKLGKTLGKPLLSWRNSSLPWCCVLTSRTVRKNMENQFWKKRTEDISPHLGWRCKLRPFLDETAEFDSWFFMIRSWSNSLGGHLFMNLWAISRQLFVFCTRCCFSWRLMMISWWSSFWFW